MPRDGNGLYTLVGTPLLDGAIAEATGAPTAMQPKLDDIADALTDSLAADGQTPWSGHHDASGFKLTGLSAATVNGDAVRYEQVFDGGGVSLFQPVDPQLTTWANVTPAAGDMFYWTNATTLTAVANTTAIGRAALTLTDPNADRILFFDDSAGFIGYLTLGSGLNITGTQLDLDSDLVALAGLSTAGLVARTGAGAVAARAIVGPAAGVTVSNADGVAGDPTLALANDLAALEGLSSTGIAVRTAADTWAQRSLVAPAAGIAITNPAGVGGDITIALANDLAALEGLGSTGIAVRSAANTWVQRSIAAGSGITVSNGDGVSGNPTVAVDSSVVLTTGVQTISGAKTFSAGMTLTGFGISGALTKSDAQPTFLLHDSDGATDAKYWRIYADSGELRFDLLTDSQAFGSLLLTAVRSGSAASYVRPHVPVRAPDGSVSAPAYTFNSDPDTGFYLGGTNAVDVATGGVVRWRWDSNGWFFSNSGLAIGTRVSDGSASAPTYGFISDTNNDTGFYRIGENQIGVATGGVACWSFDQNGNLASVGANRRIAPGDGSAGTPTYTFISDLDTGFYRINSDNVGLAIGGSLRFDFAQSRLDLATGTDILLQLTTTPIDDRSVGWRGAPVNTQTGANYTFVLSDAGKTVYHDETNARTWTIPPNSGGGSVAFPIGTTIIIDNTGNSGGAPGAITLAITTDTLRRGDGVAASAPWTRTIGANAVAVIRKTKTAEWVITGTFT